MKAPSKKKTASKRQHRRKKCLSLTGTQLLGSVVQLKEKIARFLSAGEALTIDAGAAEAFDLGSLQVLLAAQKAAESNGQTLSIVAPEGCAMMKVAQSTGFFDGAGNPLLPEAARWISAEERMT